METYRIINRELSINNQELRIAINKLKREIIYLNRTLFEQREEFIRIKSTIAKSIEQKYHETMALIYPDMVPEEKQISKCGIQNLRRSCSNATAADPIRNKSHSPPANSSGSAIMEESTSPINNTMTRTTIEQSARLSRSPTRRSSGKQRSRGNIESPDDSENSDIERTIASVNTSLNTINEEKSESLAPNETLSDATINCLLDAPCSTPYNFNKFPNDTTFYEKKCRVLVKRFNNYYNTDMVNDHTSQNLQNMCYDPSSLKFVKNSSFKTKSIQIESCHAERQATKADTLTHTSRKSRSGTKPEIKLENTSKKVENQSEKSFKKKTKKIQKNIKVTKNKENLDTDSDFTCSDEEINNGRRRLRQKQVSLKEPSLRTKLRNTTNLKL